MTDIRELAEWLRAFDGVVDIAFEGESPVRLRVELTTKERANDLISTLPLIDCITAAMVGKCTVVFEDE